LESDASIQKGRKLREELIQFKTNEDIVKKKEKFNMQKDKFREANTEYQNFMTKKQKKKASTSQKFWDSRNQSVTEYVSVKRDLYGLKRQDFESTA